MSLDPNFELQPAASNDFAWTPEVPLGPAAAPQPAPVPKPEPPAQLPTAWSPAPPRHSAFADTFRRANRWVGAVIQRFTLPEDDTPADPLGKLVASTPPWFISLIVHFSLMILLGLAVLGAARRFS